MEERHPNFHAAKFMTDITKSYYECIRGDAKNSVLPDLDNLFVTFVEIVETHVDKSTGVE